MADDRLRRDVGFPRGQTDLIYAGSREIAARIHNLVATETGTLRTVVGPCEYTHERRDPLAVPVVPGEGRMPYPQGIHHAVVEGGRRHILLAHFQGSIWEHQGWTMGTSDGFADSGWQPIVGSFGSGALQITNVQFSPPKSTDFLTQFVSVPNGVVIIPQEGRAHFYNGEICLPLGYDRAPGTPIPQSPVQDATSETAGEWSDTEAGYLKDGRTMNSTFGTCRIGTIRGNALSLDGTNKSNPLGGIREPGEWRTRTQFVNIFGDVSPPSPPSAPAVVRKEDNLTKDRKRDGQESAERLRVQFIWMGIDQGPDGTVGRILNRTRDQKNSGIPGYFEMPPDALGTSGAFATIPDNETTLFPDNIPDDWLVAPMSEVVPVRQFRVAAQAFGRLWVGNWAGQEGLVRFSVPGRWGTFLRSDQLVPDPRGWGITGFLLTSEGLLVFTEVSTHMVTPNEEGDGFRAITLSITAGCVSPDSAAVIPGGPAVWLGREGFYSLQEGQVVRISQEIQETVIRRINKTYWRHSCAVADPRSGEYRCWVPLDADRKTLCAVYDGTMWRTRDDVDARGACVTQDHRAYSLVIGYADTVPEDRHSSVWVLDHDAEGPYPAKVREAVVETTWLRAAESETDVQQLALHLWVRETTAEVAPKVEIMRDWRTHPPVHTVTDNPRDLLNPNGERILWGSAEVGGTYTPHYRPNDGKDIPYHWTRRTPFWVQIDTHNPSKTFKARVTVEGDFELVGYYTEEVITESPGVRPASRIGSAPSKVTI